MGRKSALSDKQWDMMERRLLAGELACHLAKEFGVSPAAVSRRFHKNHQTAKQVAVQMHNAEQSLRALPIAQQIKSVGFLDELRAISNSLGSAARYGANTAHRVSAIANKQVDKIDENNPENSVATLQSIAALTKIGNEAAQIPLALLSGNREAMRDPNAGASYADVLRGLVERLPR